MKYYSIIVIFQQNWTPKLVPLEGLDSLFADCRFEVWMLAGHTAINPTEKLFTNPAGITIHRDDLMKINDEDFVSEFFRAAGLLRKLNLTNIDIALLKGITLLSRGIVTIIGIFPLSICYFLFLYYFGADWLIFYFKLYRHLSILPTAVLGAISLPINRSISMV